MYYRKFFENERDNLNNENNILKRINKIYIFITIISGIGTLFVAFILFCFICAIFLGIAEDNIEGLLGICIYVFVIFIILLVFTIMGIIGIFSPNNTIMRKHYDVIKEIIKKNTNTNENSYKKEEWEYIIDTSDFNTIKKCLQAANCWGNYNCTFFCNQPVKYSTRGVKHPGQILLFNQFDNNISIIPLILKADGKVKAYIDLKTVIPNNNILNITVKDRHSDLFYNNTWFSIYIKLRSNQIMLTGTQFLPNSVYSYTKYFYYMCSDNLSKIFDHQEENLKKFIQTWNK